MSKLNIPDFDGRPVDLAHNAFSGKDETPPSILDPGEEAFLIVRVITSGVAHKENKFGHLGRVQSLSVTHSMPADERSIKKVQAEIKRQQDEESGQESLDAAIDEPTDG